MQDSCLQHILRSRWFGRWSWMCCRPSLYDAARTNTIRANSQLLTCSLHHCPNALQVRIPTPATRVIRVADDVAILRPFAADFTLLCHDHSCLLFKVEAKLPVYQRTGASGNKGIGCDYRRSRRMSSLRLRAFIAGVPVRAASRRVSITLNRMLGSFSAKSANPCKAKVLTMELRSWR
jgi:hypothetical protein